jgi:hypothetical protein
MSSNLLSITIWKSSLSKKKFTDRQHSTNKAYSDTITDWSQRTATHETSEEDWGDSGRLTYHNPQTKKPKSTQSRHGACKSIISGWFLYSRHLLRANLLITPKKMRVDCKYTVFKKKKKKRIQWTVHLAELQINRPMHLKSLPFRPSTLRSC